MEFAKAFDDILLSLSLSLSFTHRLSLSLFIYLIYLSINLIYVSIYLAYKHMFTIGGLKHLHCKNLLHIWECIKIAKDAINPKILRRDKNANIQHQKCAIRQSLRLVGLKTGLLTPKYFT